MQQSQKTIDNLGDDAAAQIVHRYLEEFRIHRDVRSIISQYVGFKYKLARSIIPESNSIHKAILYGQEHIKDFLKSKFRQDSKAYFVFDTVQFCIGELLKCINSSSTSTLAISSDGIYHAYVKNGLNSIIFLHNLKSNTFKKLHGNAGRIEQLQFGGSDYLISLAGQNLLIWSVITGENVKSHNLQHYIQDEINVSPHGDIFCFRADNYVVIRELLTDKNIRIPTNGSAIQVFYAPDGKSLLILIVALMPARRLQSHIIFYDIEKQKELKKIESSCPIIRILGTRQDSVILIVVIKEERPTIMLLNTITGEIYDSKVLQFSRKFRGLQAEDLTAFALNSFRTSAHGKYIAMRSDKDKSFNLYDSNNGDLITQNMAMFNWFSSYNLLKSNNTVVSFVSYDNYLNFWHTALDVQEQQDTKEKEILHYKSLSQNLHISELYNNIRNLLDRAFDLRDHLRRNVNFRTKITVLLLTVTALSLLMHLEKSMCMNDEVRWWWCSSKFK